MIASRLAQGEINRYAHGMAQAVRKAFAAGADTYDRARRKLVPCFDDFYRMALELLPFALDARFEVLDLGAGTGLLSAMIAAAFPKARLTLFDLTPEMLIDCTGAPEAARQTRALRDRRFGRRRPVKVLRRGGVGFGAPSSTRQRQASSFRR